MLLQSLVALSQSENDGDALYSLTAQLAELTASCDRHLETLVHVADQKAQIQRVQDLHVASALAMALRKLNASYAKRSDELKTTRARLAELEAELEEAWNMAQDMAQEMDDLDNFALGFDDEDDPDAEGGTPDVELADEDEPPMSALDADVYGDADRASNLGSVHSARVVGVVGHAVATKATLVPASAADRASRVSAAKKRSSRASKASLRIARTPTQGSAHSRAGSERRARPDRSSVYSIHARRRSRSKSLRRAERGGEAAADAVPDVPVIRLPEPNQSREGSSTEHARSRSASLSTQCGPGDVPPVPPKSGIVSPMHLQLSAFPATHQIGDHIRSHVPCSALGGDARAQAARVAHIRDPPQAGRTAAVNQLAARRALPAAAAGAGAETVDVARAQVLLAPRAVDAAPRARRRRRRAQALRVRVQAVRRLAVRRQRRRGKRRRQ